MLFALEFFYYIALLKIIMYIANIIVEEASCLQKPFIFSAIVHG